MAPQTPPVWFITGCSSGFGHALATLVLARGWRAVVTARDKARVADLARGADDRALALDLDITDATQITAAVAHFPGRAAYCSMASTGERMAEEWTRGRMFSPWRSVM